jgi:hypothetical protein
MAKQIQIEKTATKTRALRATGKGKQAPQKPQQAAQEAAPSIKFAIADYARPKAGAALFAHTAAFLALSGINAGQAYPKSKAAQIIGQTAVKYHSANGNFEQTAEGLKLTDKGRAFFAARGETDKELLAAFTEVMTEGKVNDKANVKAESSRVAVK